MKKIMRLLFVMIITASLLSVQTLSAFAADEGSSTGEVRISLLGKYDSADTASVKQINTISKTIQFRNHDTGKNYTLKYDNTSQIYDIHGEPVSASMLEEGQIVDITFLRGSKHLNSLVVSDDAWVEAGVHDFSLVNGDETAKINGKVLHITKKTLIISDGQAVNPEDILETDTLRVSGIDKEIYSIVVTRGHGYVSLSSDTVNNRSLVGAWIELDKEVIRKITPKMLISAPEGSYNVSIAGNGTRFSSEIIVNRNEETVIDTSVVEIEEVKEGNVTFVVTPEESRVFVDGKEVLTEVPQSFSYGKHKLHVMAEGYKSQDHYLKVAEADATLFIELEKNEDDSSKDSSTEESTADETDSSISDSETSISSDLSNSANETRTVVEDGSTSNSASTATSQRDYANSAKTATAATTSSNASTTATVDPSAATTSTTVDVSDSTSTSSNSSDSDSTSDSGDSSSEEEDENVISGYKVSFDAPIGAEAYLDGNYVGIIPVSFAKVAGQHMVTLQKEGYQTKSYTIQIDSEKTNVTYTFPEMAKEKPQTDDSDNGNTSDNGNSDNTSDNGDTGSTSDNGNNGDTSDSGNTGSTSDSGNTGTTSDSGNTGTTSDSGNTGTTSDSGNTGTTSDSGNTGTTSDSGNTGTTSDSGNTGTTSDSGNTGTTSDSGNTGTTSDSGNTGTTSDNGDTGNTSDSGNTGNTSDSGNTGSTADSGETGTTSESGESESTQDSGETTSNEEGDQKEETSEGGETGNSSGSEESDNTGETGGAATITVNP